MIQNIIRWLKNKIKSYQHHFVFVEKPNETEHAFKSMGYVKGDYTCDKCGLKLVSLRDENKKCCKI